MGDRYEIWFEGPQGKVKLAECFTYNKVLEILGGFEKFYIRHETWPDAERIIIEFPKEKDGEAQRND